MSANLGNTCSMNFQVGLVPGQSWSCVWSLSENVLQIPRPLQTNFHQSPWLAVPPTQRRSVMSLTWCHCLFRLIAKEDQGSHQFLSPSPVMAAVDALMSDSETEESKENAWYQSFRTWFLAQETSLNCLDGFGGALDT